MDGILIRLTFAAAIGSGLISGVFFAFSTFVMKALGRLPGSAGMAAMQSINVVVLNPIFLGVFMGTALLCAVAAVGGVMRWDRPGGAWVVAGAALYLLGTFGVTILLNVPLNNALATIAPDGPQGAGQWAIYVSRWTMWNHVRTAAALAAMGAFVIAFRRLSASPSI